MKRAATATGRTQHLVPGIYGGLGPLAHIRFEQELLARAHARGARRDQEHPDYLLVSAASTPDRTESIRLRTGDALASLLRHALLLERSGADFLLVLCNTAHAFHAEVQRWLRIPWLSLVEMTIRHVETKLPGVRRVGLIGTDGTLLAGVYQRAARGGPLAMIAPEVGGPVQRSIMEAIYDPQLGIKAGGAQVSPRAIALLDGALQWFGEHEVDAIISACTEISVWLGARVSGGAPELSLPIVDPLVIAAETTLDLSFGIRRLDELSSFPVPRAAAGAAGRGLSRP